MTKKERKIADALSSAMILNVADKQARTNIAVAVGQVLFLSGGIDLDRFVKFAIIDWSKVEV